MPIRVSVRANTYFDSVFLMSIAARLAAQPGVTRAAVLMATPANRELLAEFGVAAADLAAAGAMDLVLGVDAVDAAQAAAALGQAEGLLETQAGDEDTADRVSTLDEALARLPEANLAVISVPGEYATYEARRALERNLDVFLFSDNVTIADELALKQDAAARGRMLLGPDCGTALLGGAGIGFANGVRRGSIGLVGPSGTGLQQVSSLIHQYGGGVSHAIGVGGRDLSDAIGGLSTLQALDALAADPETRIIVVVSKPPGPDTKRRVLAWAAAAQKPVVTCFLGPDAMTPIAPQHCSARTLTEAVHAAARLAGAAVPDDTPSVPAVDSLGGRLRAEQVHVRGLFAGGTFCYEAQQIFVDAGLAVRSNAPLPGGHTLSAPPRGEDTSMVDLGDDAFTRGRPHPMIDATLRNASILFEAEDGSVAALLLDFILGYGAAADPVGDAAPAIVEARLRAAASGRELLFVASVCGTDADAQDRAGQIASLEELGVIVLPSSSEAAAYAAALVRSRRGLTPQTPRGTYGGDALDPAVFGALIGAEANGSRALVPRLLREPVRAVALGVRLFSAALQAQGVPVVHVDWTPPAGGDTEMLELLADLL